MKRAWYILTALIAVLSVGCQPTGEPSPEQTTAGEPGERFGGLEIASQPARFDTVYEPGTYVFTEDTDDGVVTETLTVPKRGPATLEIDRPGDDEVVKSGVWEQTFDGIRIDYSRRSEGLDEDQRYYSGLEDGDLTEKAGSGKVYVRVLHSDEQE